MLCLGLHHILSSFVFSSMYIPQIFHISVYYKLRWLCVRDILPIVANWRPNPVCDDVSSLKSCAFACLGLHKEFACGTICGARDHGQGDGAGEGRILVLSGIQHTMGGGAHCERHLITRKSARTEPRWAAVAAKSRHVAHWRAERLKSWKEPDLGPLSWPVQGWPKR